MTGGCHFVNQAVPAYGKRGLVNRRRLNDGWPSRNDDSGAASMKLKTLMELIHSGRSSLMLKLLKMSNEFYRAVFISTACSQGIYLKFINGESSFEQLREKMGATANPQGLFAWLELGVALGELKRCGNKYQIRGKLSREFLKPENDAYQAVLEEIVKLHYNVIVNTPAALMAQKLFPFNESTGELVARSSRIAEPFILEAADDVIPQKGKFRLLEVGCGSGIYIKKACERNPELTATGIELQQKVADFARKNISSWGLDHRVTIEHCDIKKYPNIEKFDLITLHQNIYYFAVDERADLARNLIGYLKPGGRVLLTSICQHGSPGFQALDILCSNTDAYGALPYPDQLCRQLKEAGFRKVKRRRLIPFDSFWAFVATKPL